MWRNARFLKLDWWLAGLALLVVTSLSLTRCGGTGSDLVGFPEGDTFVNEGCGTDSTCLRFSISPSRIPADGVSTATFIATLFNADGSPAADEQVCFFVEDTAAATILEPVGDNCQLTGPDGRVSGRVQAGLIPVSVRIVARSFSRSLETSVILLLGEASAPEPVPAGLSLLPEAATLTPGQSVTLTARLRNSNNEPIAGATIVFTRIPAAGSLSASSATTDAGGQASVVYTAGSLPSGAEDQEITITAQSGTLADNSQITVQAFAGFCGDGVRQTDEQCDDGNTNNCDGCSAQCEQELTTPVCGNGELECGEECDDDNTFDGDGCSATCVETTQCSDGVDNDGDGNVDGADAGCAGALDDDETDPVATPPACAGTGSVCTVGTDCCSGVCTPQVGDDVCT